MNELGISTQVYTLKKNTWNPPDTIKLIKTKNLNFVFPELYQSMCSLKSKIDQKENSKLWDKAKKRVNPYELVNAYGTNILKNETNKNYNNCIPLSRAFFKLTEIFNSINIIPKKYIKNNGVVANTAEGPGGFIEAIYKYRVTRGIKDKHYGVTLYSKEKNIPGWDQLCRRKNHFLNNQNIKLITGNLYNISSIKNYSRLFKEKKAWLVTGDGGFDYSSDFNNQESNSNKIIYAEILTALMIQEKGGTMICKMFDLFTCFSLQLVYLLTLLYENVSIVKPVTSRPANSEKYIVARKFKKEHPKLVLSMLNELPNFDSNSIIETIEMSPEFIKEMKKINIMLTEYQKKYIKKTLNYIKNDNPVNNKAYQIKNAKIWFNKHNILSKEKLKNKKGKEA